MSPLQKQLQPELPWADPDNCFSWMELLRLTGDRRVQLFVIINIEDVSSTQKSIRLRGTTGEHFHESRGCRRCYPHCQDYDIQVLVPAGAKHFGQPLQVSKVFSETEYRPGANFV